LVILAVLVAAFIPDAPGGSILRRGGEDGDEVGRNRRRAGRSGSRAAAHRSDDSYSSQDEDNEYKLPLIKEGDLL
jgi:hypothetical protein